MVKSGKWPHACNTNVQVLYLPTFGTLAPPHGSKARGGINIIRGQRAQGIAMRTYQYSLVSWDLQRLISRGIPASLPARRFCCIDDTSKIQGARHMFKSAFAKYLGLYTDDSI